MYKFACMHIVYVCHLPSVWQSSSVKGGMVKRGMMDNIADVSLLFSHQGITQHLLNLLCNPDDAVMMPCLAL